MASKVSELTALTGAAAATGDKLYIVDVSAGTSGSKSITLQELFSLADSTLIKFGSSNDVTIGWDGTDLDVAAAANNSVWNFGDGTASFDVKTFGASASDFMLWDASANTLFFQGDSTLVIGHTAQLTVSDGDGSTNLIPETQVIGTSKADSSLLIAGFNTTNDKTVAPSLCFLKSGHGTAGSNTTVAADEVVGEILFFGADGTDFESPAGGIRCEIDGTVGAGDMPGRLVFLTTADGGETLTEVLRLTTAGDARINNGGGLIVGSTSAQITISDGDGSTNLVPEVQILGTAKADGSLLVMVNSATATSAAAPSVNLVKSAHATIGSNTIVVSGEVLGEVNFFGADGVDFESCAVSIRGVVDNTPGAGDMPGRLSIFCSADGAEAPLEKVRITGAAATALLQAGIAGTSTGKLILAGATSNTVTIQPLAAAGNYTLTLPPDDGDAGEQLQTDGSGVMTWEAAGSLRAVKNVIAEVSHRAEATLAKLLGIGVYEFTYQEGARPTTRDFQTHYTGVMADELPEVMHHGGRIFSPVSAFGEMLLALKGLAAKVERLEERLSPV